ncbi:bifunctional (p)ppGpp synthetase/guanosine-3',5'-bis(diphosphate) 3'-pyrophosphohydrolase [Rubrobacter taiwanensis]|uniref:Bifunctional (P)ppGpp synthetase/guanosine-3',5'-bis(Diphosphate) 3'-pyrophosphohydrolase n=1 Tax=Rubrobacter taiwanensis TaxID=185139 RepID=A0A4R1BHK7_9ACTN|nr:bifunctional (p)ppGpp synthetase/guanosine-3',5'-bis(diphosphate) 3'-pyrophosphohydrolase [Rubrobacter taiwanensis]TCJ16701.1 bifunctional (p)ppGpp synthetase/guanosine-3',5'-bis(diphosphate) 3'-pyrophosphohydrolase [Rubrobacter taiwanensis]
METARTDIEFEGRATPAVTISSLLEKIASYDPEADEELIANAYRVAHRAHTGQVRKSGEPFIYHPLCTADILANLKLDSTTIAAALLHDVIEDTGVTREELEEEFGEEIALIVDGVTKLKRLPSGNLEEAQAESLRKMIVAMSRDVRVIIIKLADRLHNMRTLDYLKRETQLKKATETLEIYAPLAHRLGIYSLKWELEDLAFATLHPRRYEEIKRLVAARREEREAFINRMREELAGHLKRSGIRNFKVQGRAKHFYSIYNKMVRRNKEFNEIYDLTGLRVIVESIRDCYGALGVIHSIWKPIPGRFKDYIAMPKFNMYQSLHTTVMSSEGKLLEIQIRTEEMNATAEYGIAAHWMYKQGAEADPDRPAWLKSMLEWQQETQDSAEFMESLKGELFVDEVYVFTPKGDVVSLPSGATPIDFAYHIHTEVGHQCVGAKVNGQIVPLDSELVSGDRVEIITSKSSSGPSRDWLSVVKSGRARNKIRQYFNRADREDNLELGREKVQALLKKHRVERVPARVWDEVAETTNYNTPDDLLTAVGAGVVSAESVANRILEKIRPHEEEEKEPVPALAPLPIPEEQDGAGSDTGVRVVGSSGILTRLARCCSPMPGDEIVGYVSLGRGVVVHSAGCLNAISLKSRNPERFVEVEWTPGRGRLFTVELQVEALDRMHLLRDVTSAISDCNVNIISARVDTIEERTALSRFAFKAASLEHVEDVIRKIRSIPDVYDVYRVSRDGTRVSQ